MSVTRFLRFDRMTIFGEPSTALNNSGVFKLPCPRLSPKKVLEECPEASTCITPLSSPSSHHLITCAHGGVFYTTVERRPRFLEGHSVLEGHSALEGHYMLLLMLPCGPFCSLPLFARKTH
jgi:hypothetical protein